jgi:Skp family chaperone for outer membrane proteins
MSRLPLAALAAAALLVQPGLAVAQTQGPGWFVPAAPQAPRPAAAPRSAPRVQSPPPAQPIEPGPQAEQQAEQVPPAPDVPLPPVPDLPPLPKQAAPPAAVIGVLGVPEIMRASAAAQAIQKAVGERRQKLAEDAQKEQAIWRDMQQSLTTDRTKLSPQQIRERETELQSRVTNAQRSFRERNQIIQNAAQYAFAQVEQSLVAVIRQVAEAHGMNLVLHRAQVALNVNEFDITDQVAAQLNTVLPSVMIPPDGMSVADFAKLHPLPGNPQASTQPQALPVKAPPAASPGAGAAPAPAPAKPAP